MSLFGGAECSTSRNPLAQFSKHAGEDRSLHRSSFTHQFQNQSMREDVRMSQQDQQRMNQFMNHQDSFNFQPISHELHRMQPQQQPQLFKQKSNSAWSSEFQPQVNVQRQSPQLAEPSTWGAEFQNGPAITMNGRTSSSPSVTGPMMMPRLGNGLTGNLNPMYSNFNQRINSIPANSKVQELGNQQWDDQFEQIDAQFKELSKQEGKQTEEEEVVDQLNKEEEDIVIDDKDQANFQEVWDALHEQNDEFLDNEPPSWEKDFARYAQARSNFGQYKFESTNQFSHSPNAYEIGLTLMQNGAKLSEAALAFEAAVQENPQHIDAWLRLGEVQTQNEKEIAGLTALEKCLALDPKNLDALMTLAVSYINEGYDNAAFATLERWIETKYPQVTDKARLSNPKINDEDRYSIHKRVIELYIQAAQLSPSGASIDADVQMGLGVLFYANEDYNKTIDCFKAALAVRPNDELLWNRLGASLANSNRSEEAIEAYHRALQLKPSFVRARYNLGVSSINIGCYKEAAEHLLGALSMHNVEGVDTVVTANQSTSIMETLKRAFIAMDRRDLLEKIRPGMDINVFRDEFNF